MITIREALQLPVFKSTNLVAGAGGLDNIIRWVHTVDIPDAKYEWKRRGVLLLTAGYGLQDNVEKQQAFIPTLVKQGFAGMVLCLDYYHKELPQVMRQAADELNFPIITSPADLLFIHIAEAILEIIINRQYTLLQRSSEIYEQLTELVLHGGTLQDLANTLTSLIDRSLIIEDATFKAIAIAEYDGEIDESRQESIKRGRTSPKVSQALLDAGIYKQLLETMAPVHVPPMPELGMTMGRVVVPIIVGREIYGYIWTITGEPAMREMDEIATRHGATIAALMMFKERAIQEAEAALRGDFFEQLLNGISDRNAFQEQARRLNFRLERPHQIVLVYGPPRAGGSAHSLQQDINDWLRKRALDGLTAWRNDCVVLVLEFKAGKGEQLAQEIMDEMSHPARRLLIGVGNTVDDVNEVKDSYTQAWEAIQVGRTLGQTEGVLIFAELGVLHWLYHLPPDKIKGNAFLDHIMTLVDYDEQRDAELVKTLEGYLDHGGSLVETAEILHIHRNTLIHRLKRIEELCEVDLRHPIQRLNLHVAVKSYHLNH